MKLLKKIKRIANARKLQSHGTNNLPPITFHSVCGENIRISSNGAVACRVDSFCKGICFSSRPIRVNERVCIRFKEMLSLWSGQLRFGFTTKDPTTYHPSGLPKYVCPDLTSSGHTYAKALPERFAQKGNILHFYLSSAGNVHFGINGDEKGIILSNVKINGPVWAIIDVYGNTTMIESVDPRHNINNSNNLMNALQSSQIYSSVSMVDLPKELAREPSPQFYSEKSLEPATFHSTRGGNVRLSANKCIAERNANYFAQGYVFGARPLMPNEKIVVQILKTDLLFTGSLAFGLTSVNPSLLNIEDFPDDSHQLLDRSEYWTVVKNCASLPQAGDELAFSVASNGKVIMQKNRQKPVVLMHVDSSLPLYPFFDLYGSTTKIRLLGTSFKKPVSCANRLNSMFSKSMHSVNQPIYQPPIKRSTHQPIYEAKHFYTPEPVEQIRQKPLAASEPIKPSEKINSGECAVCYEQQVNSVLYSCGHICMCYDCSVKQWKTSGCCPICRAPIRDVIRTYWS